jgi:hypothetical protein
MRSAIKIILFTIVILSMPQIRAQQTLGKEVTDSTRYSLLVNPFIQIEATEAIDAMYNFQFTRANAHFNYLKSKYPWHPLPYLLKGLNYWWQIVPNYENEEYDDTFLAYMDTTQRLAERLEEFNKIESAFFLAAAYAFEGRLYSERRQYRKAAVSSKNALKYLGECRGYETYSPELLFGDALFNYYAEWIREEYPMLKPLMWFFPEGDKEKGIAQLREVTMNAFYSRTEAQYYLMRILSGEEADLQGALRVSGYLVEHYPQNAYFERYHARLLYQAGQFEECEQVSRSILDKIDHYYEGYESNSGRYACFFLGHIYRLQREYDLAKSYYERGLKYAEEVNATDRGYYHYSLYHLGLIAEAEGDDELAEDYYKRVRKLTKNKQGVNKMAKGRLKELD